MAYRVNRTLALARYLRRPVRRFLPLFAVFNAVLLLGGWAFHALYTQEPLSFLRALYITYALVFMEHLLPFPTHWVLQLLYIALPPLGLVVILDALVEFGGHVVRRDDESRDWNAAMIETLENHVILCGLGKAGFRILQVLARLEEPVCVLEKDPRCANLAWARQRGIPVVVGEGREAGIFETLGAGRAKSILLATDDDLANLEMALDARKLNPTIHIVLRLWDQELAHKIKETLGVSVAFSTTALAAPLFATASSDSSIVNAFEVGESLLVVSKITVGEGSRLIGQTIGQVAGPRNVWVLGLQQHGEDRLSPPHETVLAAGDVLTLQTEPGALKAIHAQNRPPSP